MTIKEQVDIEFDPTDSNACADVVEASVKILKLVARALWANNHNMRMGRDDASELGVAMNELGHALNLLPYRWNGAESEAFFRRLLSETGIDESPIPSSEAVNPPS